MAIETRKQITDQFHPASRRYANWFRETYLSVKSNSGESTAIEKIFIPIRGTLKGTRETLDALSMQQRFSSFLVVGAKGIGKTTLLKRMAAFQLNRFSENPDNERCPIYVALVDGNSTDPTLWVEPVQKLFPGVPLEALLQADRVVLFLDGLDEIGLGTGDLVHKVNELKRRTPQARLILASRYWGHGDKDLFPEIQLNYLSSPEIDAILSKWLSNYEMEETRISHLLNELKEAKYCALRGLINTPLLAVQLVCYVVDHRGLPSNEGKFVQTAILQLISNNSPGFELVTDETQLEVLSRLAIRMCVSAERHLTLKDAYSSLMEHLPEGVQISAPMLVQHFISVGVLILQSGTVSLPNEAFAYVLISSYAIQSGDPGAVLRAGLRLPVTSFQKIIQYFVEILDKRQPLFQFAEAYNREIVSKHRLITDLLDWLAEQQPLLPSTPTTLVARIRLLATLVATHFYAVCVLENVCRELAGKKVDPAVFLQQVYLGGSGEAQREAQRSLSDAVSQLLVLSNCLDDSLIKPEMFEFEDPQDLIEFLEPMCNYLFETVQASNLITTIRQDFAILERSTFNAFAFRSSVEDACRKVFAAISAPPSLRELSRETGKVLSTYLAGPAALAVTDAFPERNSVLNILFQHWKVAQDRTVLVHNVNRTLCADVPEKVSVNTPFMIRFWIRAETKFKPIDCIARQPDLLLHVNILAPSCEPRDLWQMLFMPGSPKDSDPLSVMLTAKERGRILLETQIFSDSNRIGYFTYPINIV